MKHVVVAVNLRDCGNVGAIARTATAFGFGALVTVGTTPPLSRKEAQKVALGGGALPSTHVVDLAAAFALYPDHHVVALETSGEPLEHWQPPHTPLLILLGSERYGLTDAERAAAHTVLRITQAPSPVASLNVAAAFAIAAHMVSMIH